MTKQGGWVVQMTKTSALDFGSNPAHQWDTKRELFNLAEVFCSTECHCTLFCFAKCHSMSDFHYSVCLSVCLFVCLSPTGHNSKPIVMKLYQDVEVVSTEKPLDFEVKGQLEVKFRKSSIFIRLTWKVNSNCIVHYWIGKPTIFEIKRSRVNSRSNF